MDSILPSYKTLHIGITGGIGSGKSVVCRIFQVLGAPIYDADFHAKRLMVECPSLVEQIKLLLGEDAYLTEKQGIVLNRTYIAKIAFQNPEKLAALNALVHPAVRQDYNRWKLEYDGKVPYVVREAALLLESGFASALHYIIGVIAPENLRIKRTLKRDAHRTVQDIQKIISKQLSEQEFRQRVNIIIQNDDVTPILPQILALHQTWIAESLPSTINPQS